MLSLILMHQLIRDEPQTVGRSHGYLFSILIMQVRVVFCATLRMDVSRRKRTLRLRSLLLSPRGGLRSRVTVKDRQYLLGTAACGRHRSSSRMPEACVRLEHDPGEEAQVDFGSGGRIPTRAAGEGRRLARDAGEPAASRRGDRAGDERDSAAYSASGRSIACARRSAS